MSRFQSPFGPAGGALPLDYESRVNVGVAARFFNAVYAWMAAGLAITALVAWWVSTQPAVLARVFSGGTILFLVIAELALVWTVAGAVRRINATAATALFLLYAALNGLTLSIVFLAYAKATIVAAFVVSAGMFGAMSVYGMVTRRDLTALGSLLFMGLIGLILASIVSVFWHNTFLSVMITYLGVFIFTGLTAYDTQRLKMIAYQVSGDAALTARYSIVGALTLYLDFINLFLYLLQLFSENQRRS